MSQALWKSVLGEVELSVSRASYSTWFKNTELVECNDSQAVIEVPNIFTKQQLEVKFNGLIAETLKKNGAAPKSIVYTIRRSTPKTASNREITRPATATTEVRRAVTSSPLSSNGLNPRYTFDTFIVGSSNDLAHAACQAVAADPGKRYNPLFIYGGVGLGKTHLIQAVGNEITKNHPDMRVLYISSETFVTEFIDSVRYKKKGFSDKYRTVDVLIIDDMQFIAGKEQTQEGFFHTFNHLHQNNKQIIISSDRPPKSIPTLTDRLRSRFEWGMPIDIQLPDFETRCAIIEAKAGLSGVELERETVEYLAKTIKTNIRELEGILNQLLAHAELRGITPNIEAAEGLLQNTRRTRPQHVTAKQIIDRTAKHFHIDSKEICSARRDKHIVVPRQVAMYLLRSELHMSFPKIAVELGRKDHTTAIHSVEKIEKAIKLDQIVREQVADIREKLYA